MGIEGAYCPALTADDFLTQGGKSAFVEPRETDATCLKTLADIESSLDIDGIAYNYNQTPLPNCDNTHPSAIVFTSSRWLTADQILAFSANNHENTAERSMIQSFFSGVLWPVTIPTS